MKIKITNIYLVLFCKSMSFYNNEIKKRNTISNIKLVCKAKINIIQRNHELKKTCKGNSLLGIT